MKKKIIFVVFLLLLLVVVEQAFDYGTQPLSSVCLKNNCFNVQIAETFWEQRHGLMFVKHLPADEGMLFVYDNEGIFSFWMKNTLIPLDIIWINSEKEVVFISENTQPCQSESECFIIDPGKKAQYVLEINGGLVEKIGLRVGDKVSVNINNPE